MEIDYATVNDCKFFLHLRSRLRCGSERGFRKKKTRGKLTYIQSTFRTYASYEPEHYTIMANGKTLTEKAFLVAVCNASQYGNNAYIAPSASINDGLLDVTIIHAGNTLSTALVGVDMLTGFIERNMLIHTFRTDNIIIERERKGASHVDGEPMEMDRRLSIRCHHNGLKVFTPTVVHPFRPILTPVSAMFNDFRIAVNNLFPEITHFIIAPGEHYCPARRFYNERQLLFFYERDRKIVNGVNSVISLGHIRRGIADIVSKLESTGCYESQARFSVTLPRAKTMWSTPSVSPLRRLQLTRLLRATI